MIAVKGAALSLLLLLVVLVPPGARTIEVHEDVNEGPSAEAPQPNATTAPLVTASALASTALPGTVNERDVNDPPPGPPSQQQRQSALHHGNAGQEAAHNFTTFPSNHRPPQQQQQHSSNTATVGQRESASPASRASEVAPGGPVTPTVAASVAPSASFRAANGHVLPPKSPSIGERLKGRQQQISGYRKRQLYASATQPRRNTSYGLEQSSEAPFVPSPEVGLPYGDDSSSPMLPIQGPAYPPSAVDALFPAATPTESRWYPSGNGLSAVGREYEKPTGHHPVWVQHDSPVRTHQVVKFPQESTVALFPAPKGKWKWIPEEEEQVVVEAPVATAGHAPSSEEHSGFGHRHPYPFDPYRNQSPATVEGGTFSSDAAGIGNGSAETTTTGGVHKELLGKDEPHRKSVSPWKKIFHVLGAAIPIGLLISALTPQVVYINPNATLPPLMPLQTPATPISGAGLQGPGGVRQRSLDPSGPDPATAARLLQKLRALERDADGDGGDESNRLERCDWKLLCQLVHRPHVEPGLDPSKLHQMLWKLTRETTTPEWARRLGLDQILRIIRDGDCGELERTCDQDT